jgi:predicted MFS family arabinose efflux permease
MNAVVRVFLPFAAGLYISLLFRVINAAITPYLLADFHMGAAVLGTMTAVFFVAFACSQLMVGKLLDRFGPRRVQSGLLVIASLGSLIFAAGETPWVLTFGRAVLAVGLSASLASGVKAIVSWFPKHRVSFANGWMLTLGSLGIVTGTAPADAITQAIGWRGLFIVLAALALAVSALIFLVVPELRPASQSIRQSAPIRLRDIYTDRNFLRVAPVAALALSVPWAMQGLWAAPWLARVDGLPHGAIVNILFVMGCAACAGGVLFGGVADRLAKFGITTETVFGTAVTTLLAVELSILTRAPIPAELLWGTLALFGSLNALGFAIMSELFPREIMGRVGSGLVMATFSCVFVVQSGMGYILALWPLSAAGHRPIIAYEVALAVPLAMQAAAFVWFLWTSTQSRRLNPIES